MANFAQYDSILWENVTVCNLDGFKTLTPGTRGLAIAWETLSVISRPYATIVNCYSKGDTLLPSSIFVMHSWKGLGLEKL